MMMAYCRTMPTSVTILTVLGLLMQGPAIALAVVLIAAGRQTGPHAGNAALALGIPFVIALIVALLGVLITLGTGAWSLTSTVGRSAGWGWVRCSSGVLLVGWLLAVWVMFLRR